MQCCSFQLPEGKSVPYLSKANLFFDFSWQLLTMISVFEEKNLWLAYVEMSKQTLPMECFNVLFHYVQLYVYLFSTSTADSSHSWVFGEKNLWLAFGEMF